MASTCWPLKMSRFPAIGSLWTGRFGCDSVPGRPFPFLHEFRTYAPGWNGHEQTPGKAVQLGLVQASEFAQFQVASFRALAVAGFGEQAAPLGKVYLGEPVGSGSEGADPQHLA